MLNLTIYVIIIFLFTDIQTDKWSGGTGVHNRGSGLPLAEVANETISQQPQSHPTPKPVQLSPQLRPNGCRKCVRTTEGTMEATIEAKWCWHCLCFRGGGSLLCSTQHLWGPQRSVWPTVGFANARRGEKYGHRPTSCRAKSETARQRHCCANKGCTDALFVDKCLSGLCTLFLFPL